MKPNAYELLQFVSQQYTGAKRQFILARLQLRTGVQLARPSPKDREPARTAAMLEAIDDVCPELKGMWENR